MSVQHEVEAADLVEGHRRQFLALAEGSVHTLPPLFCARPGGHKAPIELRTPADAPPYTPHRHRSHSSINPPHRCSGELPELLEAEQPIRREASSQSDADPPEQCPPAGEAEVLIHLFL
jgi:hypothetical protein